MCPPVDPSWAGQQSDYRERDASASIHWNYEDNWKYHTGPAIERLTKGEFSRYVMADLNFTFNHWPNHADALLALARYAQGGGKPYEFLVPECYFQRARQFAPTDPNVPLIEGMFLFKKGMAAESERAFKDALELDPSSAEAHYNLGLVHFAQKDYAAAREHAISAYRLGYPLPGLKNKLASVGQWNETDLSAAGHN